MSMLEQETPLGTLVARRDADPDYPSIWICLRRGEHEKRLVDAQYDPDGYIIVSPAWFMPQTDEYSHSTAVSENEIKQIFEENEDDD